MEVDHRNEHIVYNNDGEADDLDQNRDDHLVRLVLRPDPSGEFDEVMTPHSEAGEINAQNDVEEREGVPRDLFWRYGQRCSSRPWEVIFAFITATATMLSFSDWFKQSPSPARNLAEYQGVDAILMTALRSAAVLYTYHKFRKLRKLGSKYILGIASLFVVFSSFVFSCTVIKLSDSGIYDLKDAIFFFLILIDLSKAGALAQFALQSSNQFEVQDNIAQGMALLGPSLTLDTIVEALVVSAGTLSGISRMEQLSMFAILSIIVNYIVLMTFYPACLSLVLELSNRCASGHSPPWKTIQGMTKIEENSSNPIVQRVKMIMSAGIVLVHGIAHLSIPVTPCPHSQIEETNNLSFNALGGTHIIIRWLNTGLDQAIFMVLLMALVVKYVLFESEGHLEEQLIQHSLHGDNKMARSNSINTLMYQYSAQLDEKGTQTMDFALQEDLLDQQQDEWYKGEQRPLEECMTLLKCQEGIRSLTKNEVVSLVEKRHLAPYKLETVLGNAVKGIDVRRSVYASQMYSVRAINDLPYRHYDYTKVLGVCCENVIGYVPVPVGIAGPLKVNGKKYMIPLATTEGALVASINRGCKALANGVVCHVVKDGMTRAPCIRLPSAEKAIEVHQWLRQQNNYELIKRVFDSTSRFAQLQNLPVGIAGHLLYTRFVAKTGDAMGMNMVSKGTEAALEELKKHFPEVEVLSVSGNYCTDKKPSALNWVEGRGKSVVCEAVVSGSVVSSTFNTSVKVLVETNISKNLVGSSMAGSIGGNNAHAANIVAAMFIACGQDPAQVVSSSNCMTLMECTGENGEDLHISVTLPSLELGTVGGGTNLTAQAACLNMLGVRGAHQENPGENACNLAQIISAAVLAGELSLMGALCAGHLVQSHMALNRAKQESPKAGVPESKQQTLSMEKMMPER